MSRVLKRMWFTAGLVAVLAACAVLLPAASSAQTGATLTGTITDASTSADISGAVVEVENGEDVVAKTVTAANGSYSFSGLQPNQDYYVTASDADYIDDGQSVSLGATSAIDNFTLSPALFAGTITDHASGLPLYLAEVQLFDTSGGSNPIDTTYTDPDGHYAFSQSYDYHSGQTYYIEVQGSVGHDDSSDYTTPYYASGSINGSATEGGATGLVPSSATSTIANLNIAPVATEGTITGVVSDVSGGVPGAEIKATAQGSGDVYDTDSASNGSYVLPGLPAGSYTVEGIPSTDTADVSSYYNGAGDPTAATPVSVASPGVTQSINLKLPTGATISGTITTSSGTGIPGVEVHVETADGTDVATADTNSGAGAGAYFITGVPAGTYYVYVDAGKSDSMNAVNYVSQWYGASTGAANATQESQATPVPVSVGGGATVNQSLATGGELTGTISDAGTGTGLESDLDFYLSTTAGQSGTLGGDPVYGESDDMTGKFTIYGVQPGTYHAYVSGDSGGYPHYNGSTFQYFDDAYAWVNGTSLADSEATSGAVSVSPNATTTVNAAMPAAADIEGTLTADGQPLQGVTVNLFDAQSKSITNSLGSATTASDGTYELANLLPGTYKVAFYTARTVDTDTEIALKAKIVQANASGGADLAFQFYNDQSTLASASPVTLTAGQNQTGVNAALVPGGQIAGTVTDAATGNPLPGQIVDLLDASGDLLEQTTTAADGSYTLSSVPAGTWYVEFDATGTGDQTQFYDGSQVLAGATPVTVTAGQTTSAINGALSAATTPGQTTTVTVGTSTAPPPAVGKPVASAVKLAGIAARKVTLSFKLTAGKNAAKLKSVRVTLPTGFSFLAAALKKDLKVSTKDTYKLSKGALTITLKTAATSFTAAFKAGSISVTKALAKEARKHKLASVKVGLLITSSAGVKTTLIETVKKPG